MKNPRSAVGSAAEGLGTVACSGDALPNSPATEHSQRTSTPDSEPIRARFWKNRRGEAITVEIRKFEGRSFVDVRQHFTASNGVLKPTAKGVTVPLVRLPDLANAVAAVLAKAIDLGLVEAPGKAGA